MLFIIYPILKSFLLRNLKIAFQFLRKLKKKTQIRSNMITDSHLSPPRIILVHI